MRVLHLDSGRELRGGQRQMLLLHQGLERSGVEQTLLCLGELRRSLGAERLSALAVWRQAGRADLIHAHDAGAHTLAALCGRGTPLVVSRRVAFPVRSSLASRWKYRRAKLYLAVSKHVAERLREAGVEQRRIRLVADGVRPPSPLPAYRPAGPRPKVLAPHSPDPLKGAALATAACRQAGLELKLSDDLDADLPAADLFLYLSESEGLGSAVILAAMHAKPIVASAVGGIPELVADAETGLLVANDPARIAEALRRLVTDVELARRCAEAARQRAVDELGDDKMVKRTLEAYRSVLASSPSR